MQIKCVHNIVKLLFNYKIANLKIPSAKKITEKSTKKLMQQQKK